MSKIYLMPFIIFLGFACAPSLSSYLIEGANYSTTNNLSPSDREKCTGTLFISTRPPISDVFFDGKYIGKTNISPVKVIPGTHVLLVVKGKKYWKKQLAFYWNKPIRIMRL